MNRESGIFIAVILGLIACLTALSTGVMANTGAPIFWNPEPTYRASSILDIFLLNLILNAILLIVPLAVLTRFDYEKELTSTWAWTIPFITIVGSYADYWAFMTGTIDNTTALIIIGISYFFSVSVVLGYKFITGLITVAWAMGMNYLAWEYWPRELEWYTFRLPWAIGVVLFSIMIGLFVYNTLRFLARRTDLKKSDYLRQAFCTIATVILLLFSFMYYRI